jgi:pSer/pThr/pTyr-binding forkhead associated (FHA) protein
MAGKSKLIILSEAYEGQKIRELTGDLYTIGRVEEQDICIPDHTVSTNHCELRKNPDGSYMVQDLGSSNGTRINGERIEAQNLTHSDMLQVGGIEILYHCDDESLATGQSAQTGIDLENTAGGLQMQDLGNVSPLKKGGKKSSSKAITIAIYVTIGIVVLVVLIAGGKLLLKMLG